MDFDEPDSSRRPASRQSGRRASAIHKNTMEGGVKQILVFRFALQGRDLSCVIRVNNRGRRDHATGRGQASRGNSVCRIPRRPPVPDHRKPGERSVRVCQNESSMVFSTSPIGGRRLPVNSSGQGYLATLVSQGWWPPSCWPRMEALGDMGRPCLSQGLKGTWSRNRANKTPLALRAVATVAIPECLPASINLVL